MPTIRQNLTETNFTRRGTRPSWIVVHNTYNRTSKAGTAYNNTVYFKSAYRGASAHYFIDDSDEIWQCVLDTDTAWHVGDASSRNGATNYNAIGIEVCETNDGWFTDHEIETLTWLVSRLMEQYGIDANHVCRHYDVTTKQCPWYYVDARRWEQLKEIITGGDMPTPQEIADAVWGKDLRGTTAGDRLFLDNQQLFDRTDYSGRGKDGSTIFERIPWMAAKQEKMQASIDALQESVDKLQAAVDKLTK